MIFQKNPSAIRYADEDRGQQSYHMDLEIIIDNDRNNNNNNDGGGGDIFRQRSPSSITIISPHIRDNCVANNDNNEDNDWSQYNHRIYASYDDLRHWTDGMIFFFYSLEFFASIFLFFLSIGCLTICTIRKLVFSFFLLTR